MIAHWFPLGQLLSPGAWRADERSAAASQAIASMTSGATVIADSRLTPHLVDRTTLYLLDKGLADSAGHPLRADWVAADVLDAPGPSTPREGQEMTRALVGCGWRQVFDRDGFVVLTRPPDAPPYPSMCLHTPA